MVQFQSSFERARQFADQVRRRPGWVTRSALAAAVLVVVVPLAVLTLAAVAAFVLVFAVLGTVAYVLSALGSLWRGPRGGLPDDGRRNVRIRVREPGW